MKCKCGSINFIKNNDNIICSECSLLYKSILLQDINKNSVGQKSSNLNNYKTKIYNKIKNIINLKEFNKKDLFTNDIHLCLEKIIKDNSIKTKRMNELAVIIVNLSINTKNTFIKNNYYMTELEIYKLFNCNDLKSYSKIRKKLYLSVVSTTLNEKKFLIDDHYIPNEREILTYYFYRFAETKSNELFEETIVNKRINKGIIFLSTLNKFYVSMEIKIYIVSNMLSILFEDNSEKKIIYNNNLNNFAELTQVINKKTTIDKIKKMFDSRNKNIIINPIFNGLMTVIDILCEKFDINFKNIISIKQNNETKIIKIKMLNNEKYYFNPYKEIKFLQHID